MGSLPGFVFPLLIGILTSAKDIIKFVDFLKLTIHYLWVLIYLVGSSHILVLRQFKSKAKVHSYVHISITEVNWFYFW